MMKRNETWINRSGEVGRALVDNLSLPSGQACFDQAKAFREVVDIGSVEALVKLR